MKATIEWKDGDVWRQAKVEVKYSRNNNYCFKHDGAVYVFPLLKEGTDVVCKTAEGKWIPAGRITRGGIFLGEGLSFSETNDLKFKNETKWERPIFA
jgi:hypothetical protein